MTVNPRRLGRRGTSPDAEASRAVDPGEGKGGKARDDDPAGKPGDSELDHQLDDALECTFPASDPVSLTAPHPSHEETHGKGGQGRRSSVRRTRGSA